MNMDHDQQLGKGKHLRYSLRCSWQACGDMSGCLYDWRCSYDPHMSVHPNMSVHPLITSVYPCTFPIHVYTPYVCIPPYLYIPHMSVCFIYPNTPKSIYPPYICMPTICPYSSFRTSPIHLWESTPTFSLLPIETLCFCITNCMWVSFHQVMLSCSFLSLWSRG